LHAAVSIFERHRGGATFTERFQLAHQPAVEPSGEEVREAVAVG
jgi:hypothetical protein